MSFTITQAMVDQFNANVIMLSQQKESRLQRCCAAGDVTGKTFYAERIGAADMYERTSRHADVRSVNIPHSRRKGTVHDMEWSELIDAADTPKVLIDIQGKYVQSAVAAVNREKDNRVIEALGGVAHAGADGSTSVNNYDSGECRLINGDGTLVTAGSDASNTTETALTVAKVNLCWELLAAANVDQNREWFFLCNAHNIAALLKDTTLSGEEMKAVRDIANAKMGRFMGFTFIQMEYATSTMTGSAIGLRRHATDTGCLECYAFAQGAITLGMGQDIQTKVERRPEKNADQVLATLSIGAERNEGPAVVEILLDEV